MEEILLDKYQELNIQELEEINGGLFPIVIGGVVITAKAAAAGGVFLAGVGAGIWVGTR